MKVSIAYINVDKTSAVFNKDCFEAANNLVNKTGGQMVPLCNSTKGQSEWDMWRSFNEWNFSCVSLVTTLNLLLKEDEDNVIILNDTPFLFFAKYRDLVTVKNLKCFYFPLSTGKNHAFGDEEWRNNRIRVEKLCFEKYKDFLDEKFNNKDLLKFGIDISEDKKIIFAWGRCSIAKGFKELAQAWVLAYISLPDHFLVLQIPNNSGENEYFQEVKNILSDIPRVIIIDDFNPNIWKTILRNQNTDVVCIPSLMDPFPHTSIEAKLLSKDMNYITLISDVDGAVDAFEKDECIYVNPRDSAEFSKKIIEAVNLEYSKRKEIIDRSDKTIEKFNFPEIMLRFIKDNLN